MKYKMLTEMDPKLSRSCQHDLCKEFTPIRLIPYPYRAMLAICSDLDETPDQNIYFDTMRFLNTTRETSMGLGIGLEVGNSIYFDMPSGQFSYWSTDDEGRAMIRNLIQSGHIDCLHSFGDLATTRKHAERALGELSRNNCKVGVWVDHATAPTNFGRDIMRGQGDIKESEAYHADLSTAYGIRYVWLGRVTSVTGQDVPRRLPGIWNRKHPVISFKTFLKEYAKGFLAHVGNSRYAMHGLNQVLREISLRSGQKVYEFMRSSPHWGGISYSDGADGLSEILTEKMLSRLVEREGVCILYTHLGKFMGSEPFSQASKNALRLLARYSKDKILVRTTSRLLHYCRVTRNLRLLMSMKGEHLVIDVLTNENENNLAGLTIYTPDPGKTHIKINGGEIKKLQYNAPDHTGHPTVSLPWPRLAFPESLH